MGRKQENPCCEPPPGSASDAPQAPEQGATDRSAHSERIERLFREHNDSLVRFVLARLHSEAEAHEIVQKAYVRLLKLDEPDAVSYLRAFMYRTAANLVQDRNGTRGGVNPGHTALYTLNGKASGR